MAPPECYERVASRGNPESDSRSMRVFLYPYDGIPMFIDYCSSGAIIPQTLANQFDRIVDNTDVQSYEILLWSYEDGTYPAFEGTDWSVDDLSMTTIDEKFKEWLKGSGDDIDGDGNYLNNGFGDLTAFRGCHHLVHGGQWRDSEASCYNEGSGGPGSAPSGAGGAGGIGFNSSAFSRAPICFYNRGLTKGAQLQEPLHTFIDKNDAVSEIGRQPNDCSYLTGYAADFCEDYNIDEHTAGNVYETSENVVTTPMMEYHWDDDLEPGPCGGDSISYSEVTAHDSTLTDCTISAVDITYTNS